MDEAARERQIQEHLKAIRDLQATPSESPEGPAWPPKDFYLLWHVLVGMTLGVAGAAASLFANIIGAPLFGKPPLLLIRVFLTFPMGQRALEAEEGLVLFVGCVLYLVTGAVFGVALHLLLSLRFADAPLSRRFAVTTGFGLSLWIVNYYFILSWLQPLLLGDNWIVRLVPFWVAALTHLVFAWTILLGETWGNLTRPVSAAATLGGIVLIALGATGCGAVQAESSSAPEGTAKQERDRPQTPSDPKSDHYDEWSTMEPGDYLGYNRRVRLYQRGKLVYDKYCAGCHGDAGDGNGPASVRLITQPRDFRSGIYKFRSTDSSSLPLEVDLHRTITRGLGGGVSMPGFPLMPERDKLSVIEYIKGFYPKWESRKDERVGVPLPLPPDDFTDPDRAQRGRVVFLTMQCFTCHGVFGTDHKAEQTEFTDAWGNPQKAFDFTRGSLKGGNAPEDIYRTFATGLLSIMPAYGEAVLGSVTQESFEAQKHVLPDDQLLAMAPYIAQFPATSTELYKEMPETERAELARRSSWDLVAYVMSLRKNETTASAVLGDRR